MKKTELEIVWNTHGDYIIRDVHEKWHQRVKDFMFQNYFKPHKLFKELNFHDDLNVNEQYLRYLDHILRDQSSICVLHKETSEIYAVALLKCMTQEWRSWTHLQMLFTSTKFSDIIELQCRLIRDFAEEYPKELFNSLHMFEYFVRDELKWDAQFMNKFFNAINENARLMKMQRATFVALSKEEHDECEYQGYENISSAIYSIYRLRNERPFAALRDIDEMEASLFELQLEPVENYNNLRVRDSDDFYEPRHKSTMGANVSNFSRRTEATIKSGVGWTSK